MSDGATPAGWYDDGKGAKRWWDGRAWTEQVQESVPVPLSPREQRAADKEAKRQADEEAKAAAAFAASPVGQAAAAFERGDEFFQVEITTSALRGSASAFGSSGNVLKHTRGASDLLGMIEAQGWHLEHTGFVFVETGSTSTNRVLGTGQGVVTRGQVQGIYLFRRVAEGE